MGSAALIGDEVTYRSLGLDASIGSVTLSAHRSANNSGRDELGETVIGLVEGRESGDGASAIGDDDFFSRTHPFDVLAEAVLEFADPDL